MNLRTQRGVRRHPVRHYPVAYAIVRWINRPPKGGQLSRGNHGSAKKQLR
ncbi:hypothetical protein [Morganella phage Mecenats66]|nr:hypothetical protein [Morganella phage Mecenats66]